MSGKCLRSVTEKFVGEHCIANLMIEATPVFSTVAGLVLPVVRILLLSKSL